MHLVDAHTLRPSMELLSVAVTKEQQSLDVNSSRTGLVINKADGSEGKSKQLFDCKTSSETVTADLVY